MLLCRVRHRAEDPLGGLGQAAHDNIGLHLVGLVILPIDEDGGAAGSPASTYVSPTVSDQEAGPEIEAVIVVPPRAEAQETACDNHNGLRRRGGRRRRRREAT